MNKTRRIFAERWKRGKSAWKRATAALTLTILFLSCRSLPEAHSAIVRPTVPNPLVNGESVVTFDDASECVSMPLWYWKKIVRYIAGTEAAFDTLECRE